MEEVEIKNITDSLLSGKVDDETYNQLVEKVKSNQTTIGDSTIGSSMNVFMIWWFMGIIWFSYFIYGKKSEKIMPYLSWLGMMVIPYFIYDFSQLIWVSICFMILPFIIKI